MNTSHAGALADQIAALTGQHPASCYQCGKCSAGCPVRNFADSPPNRLVRFAQLGLDDRALAARSLWLCAGCLTCTARCPQRFDLARFIDALRHVAAARGVAPADRDTSRFHTAFLDQIRRFGRLYELGLVLEYKFRSGHMLQDATAAPGMLRAGKLALRPHRLRARDDVRRIFDRVAELDAGDRDATR
ncbi:MAG TPA: 4Fe-4S dicluster domain-containing protein [Candidatus Kapabacteria bacterium]|jgi:heterodisulfide reductase subunit C|nr:4Fe-4S dicluster domain-containing protein [Candidatus Kapabacteria bacterium]